MSAKTILESLQEVRTADTPEELKRKVIKKLTTYPWFGYVVAIDHCQLDTDSDLYWIYLSSGRKVALGCHNSRWEQLTTVQSWTKDDWDKYGARILHTPSERIYHMVEPRQDRLCPDCEGPVAFGVCLAGSLHID